MDRDLKKEGKDILKWINHNEAITITSFEWEGVKFENDGFWIKVNGEECSSWEYAISYAIVIIDMNQ